MNKLVKLMDMYLAMRSTGTTREDAYTVLDHVRLQESMNNRLPWEEQPKRIIIHPKPANYKRDQVKITVSKNEDGKDEFKILTALERLRLAEKKQKDIDDEISALNAMEVRSLGFTQKRQYKAVK